MVRLRLTLFVALDCLRARARKIKSGMFWNFAGAIGESFMTAKKMKTKGWRTILPATPSDEDLLRQARAGDEDAFTELYRRRQAGVYRFALQMSGSRALAEDVTQEVFMALIREGDRFDGSRGSLAGYLYGIARNQVLRRLERERVFIPIAETVEESDLNLPASLIAPGDPLGDLTRNEVVESIRNAVLRLPAHYREVIVLCELHEMSYAEAAEVIGCAVGTVRSRLHRARALLVEKLRGTENKASETRVSARCFA
jgi:RNA polymerase sigma-70 factor (ECF subfamily)